MAIDAGSAAGKLCTHISASSTASASGGSAAFQP
jgi:hypothetical protein